MSWRVLFTKKAAKQTQSLPEPVILQLRALVREIEVAGPVRGNWKNYGKLGDQAHHCHIKSGHPTYVVCWVVVDKRVRMIEVYYVGTHEKAPY